MIETIDQSTHSNHSAFTVDCGRKQAPLHLLPKKTTQRVSFDEDSNEYVDNRQWCHEDFYDTWYHHHDYQDFRTHMRSCLDHWDTYSSSSSSSSTLCNHLLHHHEILQETLRDLYEQTPRVDYLLVDDSKLVSAHSHVEFLSQWMRQQLDDDDDDYIHDNNDDDKDNCLLVLWGLEHLLVPSVHRELCERRHAVQTMVEDIQCEQRNGLWRNDHERQIEIRESCLNYSQSNGLFFQLIALAQAQALE